MGDYFVRLVAPDLDAKGAKQAVKLAEDFLTAKGYLQPDKSDCVLCGDSGFPPGPRFAEMFIEPPQSLGLRTNGVEVEATEEVRFYDAGQSELKAFCPHCSTQLPTPPWANWQKAMDDFFAGRGGLLACPQCKKAELVSLWKYNPTVAFGRFGITIWNSPSLKPEIIRELSRVLSCELTLISGKI